MIDEHFVTREECQRIHSILDESRRTNIAESKKERDGLRERFDVWLKLLLGLFLTFILGAGGIMLQNWQRSSAVYETRNLAREFVGRVEVMDEKVDRVEGRQIRSNDEIRQLSDELKAHTKATRESTKELQKQMKDKQSRIELEIPDWTLAMKHRENEPEVQIAIEDVRRIEYEQAIRDVVIKMYASPSEPCNPEWKGLVGQ